MGNFSPPPLKHALSHGDMINNLQIVNTPPKRSSSIGTALTPSQRESYSHWGKSTQVIRRIDDDLTRIINSPKMEPITPPVRSYSVDDGSEKLRLLEEKILLESLEKVR